MRDQYFIPLMLVLIVFPNGVLLIRIYTAKRNAEKREVVIGKAEDHRDHLLVYLFTMLLPFYVDPLATERALVSAVAAITFVVFLFWHLNLHYMNILFAVAGYRIYTVFAPCGPSTATGQEPFVIITRRASLPDGERAAVYRLSDTVYFEAS